MLYKYKSQESAPAESTKPEKPQLSAKRKSKISATNTQNDNALNVENQSTETPKVKEELNEEPKTGERDSKSGEKIAVKKHPRKRKDIPETFLNEPREQRPVEDRHQRETILNPLDPDVSSASGSIVSLLNIIFWLTPKSTSWQSTQAQAISCVHQSRPPCGHDFSFLSRFSLHISIDRHWITRSATSWHGKPNRNSRGHKPWVLTRICTHCSKSTLRWKTKINKELFKGEKRKDETRLKWNGL